MVVMIALAIVTEVIINCYILNDISDIEKDRLHPVKKFRPLASGEISKKQAYAIIAMLAAIIAVIMLFFFNKTNNIFVILIPLIYVALNILYSKKLKNVDNYVYNVLITC